MEYDSINYMKSIVEIPEAQAVKARSLVSIKQVKKDEYFLREGQFPKTIAFVKSGLFRYFYIDDKGNEFTKGFYLRNVTIH